jgi:hypothetical protein
MTSMGMASSERFSLRWGGRICGVSKESEEDPRTLENIYIPATVDPAIQRHIYKMVDVMDSQLEYTSYRIQGETWLKGEVSFSLAMEHARTINSKFWFFSVQSFQSFSRLQIEPLALRPTSSRQACLSCRDARE